MIIVKTPGFQVGSTTAAEEGGEVKGGGGERGEREEDCNLTVGALSPGLFIPRDNSICDQA